MFGRCGERRPFVPGGDRLALTGESGEGLIAHAESLVAVRVAADGPVAAVDAL